MLTDQQIEILTAAQLANPYWFDATVAGAAVMTERRVKYSGDQHPYFNFVDVAQRTGQPVSAVLDHYVAMKRSRQAVCTARLDDNILEVHDWMDEQGLLPVVDLLTNKKPPAVAYLDDRAVRFDGDFETAFRQLDGFKAFWETK